MADDQPQTEVPLTDQPAVEEEKPELCRAVILTGHGKLEKVNVQTVAKPKPGEGHVLIKVHASGLNFADIKQRQGLYPCMPVSLPYVIGFECSGVVEAVGEGVTEFDGLNFADIMQRQGLYPGAGPVPYVMGYECSGVVEAVGEGVTQFEVGTRVLAVSPTFGMMAEYVSTPAVRVFAIPDSMSFEDAAAMPLTYVTAYQILFDLGHLKEGESVLVQMAGGGVGIAATQLCKTVPNVTVFGTASQGKHEKIKEQGVTHPIDYRNNCFAKEVRKVQPEGVDIVMDPLGGKDTMKGYDLLKPFGRIICFGAANVVKGQSKSIFNSAKIWYQSSSFSPLKLMSDNRVVAGYHVGQLAIKDPEKVRVSMEALIKLHEEGKVKPEIHEVFSLEEIRVAMQCMQDRKNVGKVLLSPLKKPPPPPEPKEQPKQEASAKQEKPEEKAEDNVEDKPSEDKPSEDKPSEDKPSEDKPSEDKPSEDAATESKDEVEGKDATDGQNEPGEEA